MGHAEHAKKIGPVVLGIVITLLVWLLDKAGVAIPSWVITGGGVVVIVALWYFLLHPVASLLDHISVVGTSKVRRSTFLSTVVLSVLASGAITLWLMNRSYGISQEGRHLKTELRLQFFGDYRVPTMIYSENVFYWYALWSPSAAISFADAESKRVGQSLVVPKNWNIFVVFEKPTAFSELTVSFSSPGFPPYEIKQVTNRFAIINVSGDIPAGCLEIYAKP